MEVASKVREEDRVLALLDHLPLGIYQYRTDPIVSFRRGCQRFSARQEPEALIRVGCAVSRHLSESSLQVRKGHVRDRLLLAVVKSSLSRQEELNPLQGLLRVSSTISRLMPPVEARRVTIARGLAGARARADGNDVETGFH